MFKKKAICANTATLAAHDINIFEEARYMHT